MLNDAPPANSERGSVARRVVSGTLSNALSQTVLVAANLALIPFILHEVGTDDYGLWVLVGSIMSFVYLFDLGIAAALIKFVAEHVARDDADEAARMVGAATWLYLLLGGAAAVLGLGIALVFPDIFGLEGESRATARELMAIAAVGAAVSIPAVAPLAVLRGLQRFAIANALTAGAGILSTALTVVALLLEAGIVGVACAGVIASIAACGVSLIVVRRLAPDIAGRPVRRDGARIRRLLKFSGPVAVIQVAGRLHSKMDAIVIGAALPVSAIAPYNFAQRLAEGTRLVAEQFTRILLPLATEMGTVHGSLSLRKLLLTATRLTLALALAAALPLGLLGGEILSLWVGPSFEGYGVLVALLAASAVIDVTTYPATAVLQSSDQHRPLAWMALLSGAVNVLLSVLLVGPFGSTGVALATLVATVVEVGLLVLPYLARVLDLSPSDAGRHVLGRLAGPVVVYVLLLEALHTAVPPTSLVRLAGVVCPALIGYALAYVFLGADEYERRAYRTAAAKVARLARRRG